MKLTMAKLKRLIKEEIEKMNEGLPKPVADNAKRKIIMYKNTEVPYYYYAPEEDKGQGVDSDKNKEFAHKYYSGKFKGGYGAHYVANPKKPLAKAIMKQEGLQDDEIQAFFTDSMERAIIFIVDKPNSPIHGSEYIRRH
tara:strand:+ start:661 stop:1077 length:417 start_codon:yes stop_codon:yes gene_type:complete